MDLKEETLYLFDTARVVLRGAGCVRAEKEGHYKQQSSCLWYYKFIEQEVWLCGIPHTAQWLVSWGPFEWSVAKLQILYGCSHAVPDKCHDAMQAQ